MRNLSQRRNINQLGKRLGGRLGKQQPRPGGDRSLPGRQIRQLDIMCRNTEFGEILVEQTDGGTKQRTRRDYFIPCLQQRQHRRENRRHTRTGGDTTFTTLQGRQALLKGGHCRVGETRVNVAWLFTAELARSLCSTGINKTGRREDRLSMLLLVSPRMAGTYCQRL